MRQQHLEYLVSSDSGQPFRLKAARTHDGEVLDGTLQASDGPVFSIREGVPSFVPEAVAATQTVRSFSQKWAKHRYYRTHTARFYTDWYLQRYGFHEIENLRAFLAPMSFILDAGTGAGRDATNFAQNCAATVFGIDTAWEALDVARREATCPNVAFVHADLHQLPFPNGFFDFINCDQVIHHTPNPRAAFEALGRKLKVGGWVCCYVYRKKAVVREFTDDYIRERISGLPAEQALQACEAITRLGQALAAMKVTVDVPEEIPLLGIPKGPIDMQRFFHWNLFKCFWNDEFDFFTNNLINFDWYHPQHCFRFEPDEFRAWFASGWDIEAWDVQDAGISCRARKTGECAESSAG